jgi:hypothetical protein
LSFARNREEERKPDAAIRIYRLALARTGQLPETEDRLNHLADAKQNLTAPFKVVEN